MTKNRTECIDHEFYCDTHGYYFESEQNGGMCPGCYGGIQLELRVKERDL